MTIKVGSIVSHSGGLEWGSGKVLELTPAAVTIHFNDGKNRKIASSHFSSLSLAMEDSYIPSPEVIPVVKSPAVPRTPRKRKAISD